MSKKIIQNTFSNILKNIRNEAVRKGMFTIFDQAVISLVNAITTMVIGRTCNKGELGLYILGYSIVLIALNLQYVLIISPYTVNIPELVSQENSSYTASTLIHHLCLAGIIMLIIAAISGIMSLLLVSKELTLVMLTLCATIWPIMLKEYVRRVYIANLHILRAFLFDLSVALVQVSGLIILVFYNLLNARRAYIIIGCASGLGSLVWYIWMRKGMLINSGKIIADFIRNWSFSKWQLLTAILATINVELYPWILNYFHGPGSTGTFSACMGIINLTNPLMVGMGIYLVPLVAHNLFRKGIKGLRTTVFNSTILMATVMGIFCLIVLRHGGLFVKILYGEQFAGNDRLVGILAIGIFVSSLSLPASFGLLAMKRPDADSKGYLFVLGFNFMIGIFLVRYLGALGAGYSLLAVNLIMFITRYAFYYYWYNNFKDRQASLA